MGQKSYACSGPGRAGCRINYSLDETVVSTRTGNEASRRTSGERSATLLGPSPQQWEQTVWVDGSKYNRNLSDERLWNALGASQINATDLRTTKQPAHIEQDCTVPFFDRGGVTTRWNHSTSVSTEDYSKTLNEFDSVYKKKAPINYMPPVDREKQFLEEVRSQKRSVDAENEELVKMYGADGAEMMKTIKGMKRAPGGRGKPTPDDLTAVLALDSDFVEEVEEQNATEALTIPLQHQDDERNGSTPSSPRG